MDSLDVGEVKSPEDRSIQKKSTALLVSGLLISALSILLFGLLAEDVLENETIRMDTSLINWIHSFSNSSLDSLMFWISQIGSLNTIIAFSLITIYWLYEYKKDKLSILFFVITVGGGGILNSLLKISFKRLRPSIDNLVDALGYSFPSGHSMGSMIFYGFIGYLIIKSETRSLRTKIICSIILIVFILMIGISRIYLNAHYPSDVIAGFSAGFIWLRMCIFSLDLTKKRYQKRHILKK